MQVGKMLGSLLFGLARRMQRVRKQQQGRDECGIFSAEHAGLATAVGVASEKETSGDHSSLLRDRVFQAGAVAGGVAGTGRAEWPRLPVRQVAAEHGKAGCGEGLGEGDQQRSLGVAAGAVGQHQGVLIGSFGNVKKSANMGIDGAVDAFEDRGCGQGIILNRRAGMKTGTAVIEAPAVDELSVSAMGIFRQRCRRASTNSPHRARERRGRAKMLGSLPATFVAP